MTTEIAEPVKALRNGVAIRKPALDDANRMWTFVCANPPLERNTCYAYHLLCDHFSETCAIAEDAREMVGMVTAYRPPTRPECLFIWQIAVTKRSRGIGIAHAMITHLLDRAATHPPAFLEATVGKNNDVSRRLFQGFARKLNVSCVERVLYPGESFGSDKHDDEILLRIGPLPASEMTSGRSDNGASHKQELPACPMNNRVGLAP
ncbi:MAG: diaminobutyrate acetyltransferase [Candidatus Hydrogenedentota bacterium]